MYYVHVCLKVVSVKVATIVFYITFGKLLMDRELTTTYINFECIHHVFHVLSQLQLMVFFVIQCTAVMTYPYLIIIATQWASKTFIAKQRPILILK